MGKQYSHDDDRHPPAPGYTRAQIEGVETYTVHPAVWQCVIAAVFLFIGWVGSPYAFIFVLLRWAVTAMAVWTAVLAGGQGRVGWVVVLIAIAALYNPIVPFYSTRGFWSVVDPAVLILFITAAVKLKASIPADPA